MIILNTINEFAMKDIHDGSFPLPDLSNPMYVSQRSVIVGGKTVACGLLKLTTESILIIDKSQPLATRVKSIKALIEELASDPVSKKIQESHVFVQNLNMKRLLSHLGFIELKGEIPMMVRL